MCVCVCFYEEEGENVCIPEYVCACLFSCARVCVCLRVYKYVCVFLIDREDCLHLSMHEKPTANLFQCASLLNDCIHCRGATRSALHCSLCVFAPAVVMDSFIAAHTKPVRPCL